MYTPQAGIFALGTASHAYLEFDVLDPAKRKELVTAISALREPRTTMGGVNLVAGFRPELWKEIAPEQAPAAMEGFNSDIVGVDGFVMPATQHDAVMWLSGMAYDLIFDVAHGIIAELKGLASVADETSSWPYQRDRDLTGFIDGTENPTLTDAPDIALIAEGHPGAAGSILLLQKWEHNTATWESLSVEDQQQAMGRTKLDSVELEDKPSNSHVARTDQDEFGKIFRRNMPYGSVTNHGTMFVGFSADQQRLSKMLESMAGLTTDHGTRLLAIRGRLRVLIILCLRRIACGGRTKTKTTEYLLQGCVATVRLIPCFAHNYDQAGQQQQHSGRFWRKFSKPNDV